MKKKIETTTAITFGVVVVALAAVALLGADGVQTAAMGALGALVLAFTKSITSGDDDDRPPPPASPALMSFAVALLVGACASSLEKPRDYEAELIACNALATSLDESIACENDVRARYRRPLRPVRDAGILEGGLR
jgi:hypothetical protein